jgi:quercetin dioxygenase-like cupin family protein
LILPSPLRGLPESTVARSGTAAASERLRAAGVEPISWSNGPDDRYPAHEHPFTKLIVCAEGSITFLVGDEATPVDLGPGEGFELPPGTRHAAVVGPGGCTCVEGHRR